MKYTIRTGCWETNSSSMHSIAVTKNDEIYTHEEMIDDIYINKNGIWNIWDSNDLCFGRYPFNILYSFTDKCRYAFASIGDYWHGSYKQVSQKIEELIELITSICPEIKGIKWPEQWEQNYVDQNGNELDYDDLKYDYNFNDGDYYYEENGKKHSAIKDEKYNTVLNYYGQIDHQSMGLLDRFLDKEGITLKEFLMYKKYIVIIDGDEYYDWIRYKNSKIINTDFIDHEYPNF